MLKKIHVPLLFHYRECDSFTDYLHRQSLKGWHFKEFRFGMVFEKGEPQEKYYSAEVFPEGSEHDLRPDSDAIEYSGYCEAASWKFLDGIRKFCVFERIRENAVPIITEEEKLANILKAEKQNWLLRYFPLFLFLVFYLPFMLLQHFSDIAFQSALLFIMLGFFLYLILSVGKGLSILLWHRQAKKALNEGHPISCKSRLHFLHVPEPLLLFALFFLTAYYAIRENSVSSPLLYVAALLTIPVFNLILSTFRPGRRQQMNIRMISALAVFILSITSIFSSISRIPDRQIKVYRSMRFSFRQILLTQSQIRMLLLNIIIPKVFWEVKNPVPSGIPVPPTLIQYIILIIRFTTRLISGSETFCGGSLQRITAVSHLSGRTALTTGPDWRR